MSRLLYNRILGECPCIATEIYNTTTSYICVFYTVIGKYPFVILAMYKFGYLNLAISPLHSTMSVCCDGTIIFDEVGI
jgi:hypothetical protein